MRKRSGQVHSRESSATLQLTVSLLYQEIEACGVYNGELLCNTNKGGIYVVGAMNNGDCTIS